MGKTNHDIIGVDCIRNDNFVLVVSRKDKKNSERLSQGVFEQTLHVIRIACVRESVNGVHCLIDRAMLET